MKMKLLSVLIVIMLAIAGCSSSDSGSKSTSGQDKVSTINSMMSKGYEMSNNQRDTINQLLADGKELLKQGKTAEANKQLDEAIKLLEVIAETDRFNKSE